MRFADLVRLARQNLLRNRTRSLLTLVGVAVGVGALLTLLSYGRALQANARGEFEALELFNTVRVTSRPSPFNGLGDVVYEVENPDAMRAEVPLTDSLVRRIGQTPGVLAAYPEVAFPVKLVANGREAVANAEGIPPAFAALPAYQPTAGHFFASSQDSSVLIAPALARRLGFARGEDAVGDTLTLVTISLNVVALQMMAGSLGLGMTALPLSENRYPVTVAGLLPEGEQALSAFGRVLLPQGYAESRRKVTFFSTIDLLLRGSGDRDLGYPAVRVQLRPEASLPEVRAAIERHGVFASAFRDQFAQLERLFRIVDLALGIVGAIALLVATIGIANTLAMNVVERRREIGVMKAVGGAERDVQRLFVAEGGLLGFVGGLLGLAGGLVVMALVQLAITAFLRAKGLPAVDVFAPSGGLALGTLAVAVAVSLVAGWAPARRAARVEPVEALRSL